MLFCLTWAPWAQAALAELEGQGLPLDIVLVLDNSGSMQKNDPNYLMKSVAANFLERLGTSDQLAMIIFASDTKLVQPLRSLAQAETRQAYVASLNHLDYRGKWTNSHTAIERAIYELKRTGREGSRKIIIFMTDGILETGNPQRDVEATQWLKQYLTEEAKKNGIRIFGVAFTEAADFSMIQVLAVKTGGEYYRALKAVEIEGVFKQINRDLTKQQAVAAPPAPAAASPAATAPVATLSPAQPPTPVQPSAQPPAPTSSPMAGGMRGWLWIMVAVGAVVVILVVVLLAKRGRPRPAAQAAQAGQATTSVASNPNPPRLLDLDSVSGQTSIDLCPHQTLIGREARGNVNLVLAKPTISSLHASIEYRAPFYYLEDQRSTNGTFLNGSKLEAGSPVRLKRGDEIVFDQYRFRFVVQDELMMGHTQVGGQGLDDMATQIRPLAASIAAASQGGGQEDQWPTDSPPAPAPARPGQGWQAEEPAPPMPAPSWSGEAPASTSGLAATSYPDEQEVPPWPAPPAPEETAQATATASESLMASSPPPLPPSPPALEEDKLNLTQGMEEATLPPDYPPAAESSVIVSQADGRTQGAEEATLPDGPPEAGATMIAGQADGRTQGMEEATLPPGCPPEAGATMLIEQPEASLGATAATNPAAVANESAEAAGEEAYVPQPSPTMDDRQDTAGQDAGPGDLSQTASAGPASEVPWPTSAVSCAASGTQGQDEACADLNRTMLKIPNCPSHPGQPATELCPVCRQAYCSQCMTEKNGQDLCLNCAKS